MIPQGSAASGSSAQAALESVLFLQKTLFCYALFFSVELLGAGLAVRLDREKSSLMWWLFWQRFIYRQMLYLVIWKATLSAFIGLRQGRGKSARKGTDSEQHGSHSPV